MAITEGGERRVMGGCWRVKRITSRLYTKGREGGVEESVGECRLYTAHLNKGM